MGSSMNLSLSRIMTEQAAQIVPVRILKHPRKVYSVAFSPDGRYLISGSVSRHLHLWDLKQAESEYVTFSGHTKFVWSASFSPDGKTIASASGDGCIFLWDVESRSHFRIMESHPSVVRSLYGSAFSPDGRYLAAACMDGNVRLWSTWNRHPARRLEGHKGPVYSVCFSHDSRFLASGGDDESVRIWDVAKRREINVFARPGCRVTSILFSRDGRWLAYASVDKQIYLSDLASGEIRILKGHQELVWNIDFSPDSRFLISGSDDQCVIIWDVESASQLSVLNGHQGAVNSVAFSHDGCFAASAADDKTVIIWDLKYLQERPESYLSLVEKKSETLRQNYAENLSAPEQSPVLQALLAVDELLPDNFLSVYRQLLDLTPNLAIEKQGGGHTYTIGGYHGLSYKGQLESLLPGEYLYPETLFLHRLCNQEALYYGREGGRRQRRRLVYLLTQTGLEMSGSNEFLARTLTLALIEKLLPASVELKHSFISADLTEALDPAAGAGTQRLLTFQDPKPLAWLKVLAAITDRIKSWRNEYLEIETIWIIDSHAVSDWEIESRSDISLLRSIGRQVAWFVDPVAKASAASCRSHSLFSNCHYLGDILPQSWMSGGSDHGQS